MSQGSNLMAAPGAPGSSRCGAPEVVGEDPGAGKGRTPAPRATWDRPRLRWIRRCWGGWGGFEDSHLGLEGWHRSTEGWLEDMILQICRILRSKCGKLTFCVLASLISTGNWFTPSDISLEPSIFADHSASKFCFKRTQKELRPTCWTVECRFDSLYWNVRSHYFAFARACCPRCFRPLNGLQISAPAATLTNLRPNAKERHLHSLQDRVSCVWQWLIRSEWGISSSDNSVDVIAMTESVFSWFGW